MRITSKFVERVRKDSDIVAMITETVPLARCGGIHRAACPFCDSDSESEDFEVHTGASFFYAPCCNLEGDVFTWLMLNHRISFEEAVVFCASRFDIRDAA